jgi:ParB family transcriptional regulator, chromosome partitioning protein
MAPAPAKRGLGKGLGALIPSTPEAQAAQAADTSAPGVVPGAVYAELPIGSIEPNPRQPRSVFDPDALAELVHSIREIGLLQPVVVREVGNHYELIAASGDCGHPRKPA